MSKQSSTIAPFAIGRAAEWGARLRLAKPPPERERRRRRNQEDDEEDGRFVGDGVTGLPHADQHVESRAKKPQRHEHERRRRQPGGAIENATDERAEPE